MNNISSFTSDRECAWEFGSTVWEARIPMAKIFFFSDLLPDSILRGEQEYLVIGGEYRVRRLLY
jgi:NAD+--dinitrogen-reductase ADP-D-ribosyltransferase